MRTVFSNHTWKKRSNAMPFTLLNGESGEAVAAVASIAVKVGSMVDSGGSEAQRAVPAPKRTMAKVDNIAGEDGLLSLVVWFLESRRGSVISPRTSCVNIWQRHKRPLGERVASLVLPCTAAIVS